MPSWMERPSGPGMWVALPEDMCRIPRPQVIDLNEDDIKRGAPFYSKAVYGPIPPYGEEPILERPIENLEVHDVS